MLTAIAMGIISVAAFFVTACRIVPLRRLLGYGTALDAGFTVAIAALFFGTLAGLLIATIAGLVMALTITAGRALIGYDRAAGWYLDGLRPHIIWHPTPPRWKILAASLARRADEHAAVQTAQLDQTHGPHAPPD